MRIKALQPTSRSALQSIHGTVRHRPPVPPRWRSAQCDAAERPIRVGGVDVSHARAKEEP